MTKRSADKLSMLIDNELDKWDESGVLESMKDDDELRYRWTSYHLIGDAMRSSLPGHLDTGLADRVAATLAHEPVFLRPAAATADERHEDSASIPPRRQSPRTNTSIGFALAASMSAVAVFGMMQIDPRSGSGTEAAPSVAMASAGQVTSPVAVASAYDDRADSGMIMSASYQYESAGGADDKPVAEDLYDYLVNYHQYAAASGGSDDMLSYIRTASNQQPF